MANSSVSVSCQEMHTALGPRMIGFSGRPMSYLQGEVQHLKDDKLPSKERGLDQLLSICFDE